MVGTMLPTSSLSSLLDLLRKDDAINLYCLSLLSALLTVRSQRLMRFYHFDIVLLNSILVSNFVIKYFYIVLIA